MIISVFLETFGRFSRLCHGAVLSARKSVKRKYSFTLVNALGIIHVYSRGGGGGGGGGVSKEICGTVRRPV